MVDVFLDADTFSKSDDASEKEYLLRISETGAHSFQLSESSSEACICPRVKVKVCSFFFSRLNSFLVDKIGKHFPYFLFDISGEPCIVRPGYQVPHLLYHNDVDPDRLLLKKEFTWHIGGALPRHELEQWNLLVKSTTSV